MLAPSIFLVAVYWNNIDFQSPADVLVETVEIKKSDVASIIIYMLFKAFRVPLQQDEHHAENKLAKGEGENNRSYIQEFFHPCQAGDCCLVKGVKRRSG